MGNVFFPQHILRELRIPYKTRNIMQAIEFETHLENGLMQLPEVYRDWYNLPVKVILLKQQSSASQQEETWAEVQKLQDRLKQQPAHFSDSAELIREEREK